MLVGEVMTATTRFRTGFIENTLSV